MKTWIFAHAKILPFGKALYLASNDPLLGSWKKFNRMNFSQGCWEIECELSLQTVEYKFVQGNFDNLNEMLWQEGNNRLLKLGQITSPSLSLLSFNIRFQCQETFSFLRWDNRKNDVLDTVLRADSTFTFLQEVMPSQEAFLRTHLPSHLQMLWKSRVHGNGEGLAIIVNKFNYCVLQWQVMGVGQFGKPSFGAKLPRIILWAKVKQFSTKKTYLLINVHYDHQSQENTFQNSLIAVKLSQQIKTDEVIIAGDFNCNQKNQSISVLRKAGFQSCRKQAAKTDESNTFILILGYLKVAIAQIDHAFVRPSLKVQQFKVLNQRTCSDHFPIRIQFA